MKKYLSVFGNFILVFVAVLCTTGAVISAFSFEVDMTTAVLVWAVTALAIALNFHFMRVKGLLILLIPTLLLLLWRLPDIIAGATWAMYFISSEFYRWLFVSILFYGTEAYAYQLTLFFTALGVALSFLLSISICLRRSTWLTVLFTLPIVFLTFVVIFFLANPLYLGGLLAVYLTLLFSNALASDSYEKRSLAVFPAIGLAVLLMAITFALAPPGEHTRSDIARTVDSSLRHFASRTGISRLRTGLGWPILQGDRWAFDTNHVGISQAGTRVIHDVEIMEVVVDTPGIFYLRGYSMQHFDGNAWTVNSETLPTGALDPIMRGMPSLIAQQYKFLTSDRAVNEHMSYMSIYITGDASWNIVYTPYFTFSPFTQRQHTNPYSFEFFHGDNILPMSEAVAESGVFTFEIDLTEMNRAIRSPETYLQIDEHTAEALREFAVEVGIDLTASDAQITAQVGSFLEGFGTYTLSPFVVAEDEDFVMYFLRHSRQGFCIHYATAGTLMLRALGIPARFVSGFIVVAQRHEVGEPIVITDRYAHAWVEVFFDYVGWLPLEVTPPATGFGPSDGRPGPGGVAQFTPGWDEYYYEDLFLPDWMFDSVEPFDPGEAGIGGFAAEAPEGITLVLRGIGIGLLVAVVLAAPFINRRIVMRRREQQFTQDDTNAAAIAAWRYLNRLHRFRKSTPPSAGVEDIALKARYSQHSISEDERADIVRYAGEYAQKVYEYRNGPFSRFWVKYIRGM